MGTKNNPKKNLEIGKSGEGKYKSLFDNMSEGFALIEIILDEKGNPQNYRFLEMNKAWEKILAFPKEEALGKTVLETNPKIEKYWIEDLGRVALDRKPFHMENYISRLGKWFELHAYPTGKKMEVATIITDITERKKSEEEKNNFISVMSHELRNPLAAITSGIELTKSTLKESTSKENEEALQFINIAEQEARNMSRLLDDLLDISRISKGKISLKIQKIDLSDCVKQAVNATRSLFEQQNHSLSVSLPKNPIFINADPVRIEQVIVNLLNNAAKYTEPGGKISIKASSQNSRAEISVKDTGIGMDKKTIDSIFTSFGRFATPFVSTKGEFGIGLKLTRDMVSLHGGKIFAKSEGRGKGSEFIVSLPTEARTEKIKIIEALEIEKEHFEKLKILIVEDNENIAKLISKVLIRFGHDSIICSDALCAIQEVKKENPQMGLIDIGLPGMNGYELAKEIRKQESESSKKRMKLIALTGYGQEEDKARAKKAGFDLHLIKPVDMETLRRIVQEYSKKQNSLF